MWHLGTGFLYSDLGVDIRVCHPQLLGHVLFHKAVEEFVGDWNYTFLEVVILAAETNKVSTKESGLLEVKASVFLSD